MLTDDICRKRPAAASHATLDSDFKRFMVRNTEPRNFIISSIHFFPPKEYFHNASTACSLSSGSLSNPSILINKPT
ncbi:hypothetical protein HanXRQr2_Chr12g0533551 [Helianthus annuus]|uniref:Uncharacterized protein n=1 Tax=Helianthus annuus TaxID=4232 RepID=A0A9K3MVD6_HELAN|nr:hypothetical protein HanXRQr2_Chr12g0533551 [Helianthus annuus]KAJ0862073.1 hypothetical protein HanPSC8_Chr12g0513891 [Helianthus annuus]